MAAPRTVELKRRIADTSTSFDSRLEAVTERIDQVENESSGHFVQMKEFIFDSFQAAQQETTRGLTAVRAEMADGLAAVRTEMVDGLAVVRTEMNQRFDRIDNKLDRVLTTRPPRLRPRRRR